MCTGGRAGAPFVLTGSARHAASSLERLTCSVHPHPDIRTPDDGAIYSINEGNYNSWEDGLKRYIKWCQSGERESGKPLTARYIGSFVSDFHRNLIRGGIYIYPANNRSPKGKLRLMYEANPMALLVEQAGGMATDGETRILDNANGIATRERFSNVDFIPAILLPGTTAPHNVRISGGVFAQARF